jgi:hypothetical protein
VPLDVFDQSIGVLRSAVEQAKLDNEDRLAALKNLHKAALRLEAMATGPSVEDYMARERRASPAYGGRTVMDDEPSGRRAIAPQTTFGGAWLRTEVRPERATAGVERRSERKSERDDPQLSLFGIEMAAKRAAR